MMKYISAIPLIFVLILSAGCQQGQTEAERESMIIDSLRADVMFVHDEVMPLTADIERFVSNWEENEQGVPDSLLTAVIRELKMADEAMWDWMYAFKAPADSVSFERKKMYYLKEQERIDRVAVLMKEAVIKAEKIKSAYEE